MDAQLAELPRIQPPPVHFQISNEIPSRQALQQQQQQGQAAAGGAGVEAAVAGLAVAAAAGAIATAAASAASAHLPAAFLRFEFSDGSLVVMEASEVGLHRQSLDPGDQRGNRFPAYSH